ncbi:MAG TPA: GNAT family N-acetyltransferase [Solirubrobacteraceae bacterium]|nr:GNAT family N-acetyltransferase [Solirubrobacteraceae bacterium]
MNGADGTPEAAAAAMRAPGDGTREAAPGDGARETAREWHVRGAREADAGAVAEAVRQLLVELGGAPGPSSAMREVARTVIASPAAVGAVFVAEAQAELVGVLAASWQTAIHALGVYALIQDLWVHPAWRDRDIGGSLLQELFALARARGCARVEVGLPRESFSRFSATEGFYLRNGFAANGPRMRRLLS